MNNGKENSAKLFKLMSFGAFEENLKKITVAMQLTE